ncbi:MAG: serine/threonine-protein kinase [Sandaracinus sp.]
MSNLPRLGRYELVRKIAAGGMAEIFLARQWGAGGFFRDVVVKRLFRNLAEHPAQLRMFQDEGRLLSELSHPNIPQVYDVAFSDGYWYIAMEHVDGPTLADLWHRGARNGHPMPLPVAIAVVLQICEALHHAHERTDRARRPLRIVHRDVTPQNMMLTRDGVMKLMDFGVALTAARREEENRGAVRGTLAYMAPEQVRARPLDKRADVFALGVVLYELTTGMRLFRGSDVQVMTQVVEQDVPPPSSRIPDYPADLEQVVLETLSRDRGRRTPSAAHLAWKLEELAIRRGMLVGPRTIARYVGQTMPAERVEEDALAMVPSSLSMAATPEPAHAPAHASHHDHPSGEPPHGHDYDEDGLMDDLQLLSLPPDGSHGGTEPDSLPDPLDLPLDDEASAPGRDRVSAPLPLVTKSWNGAPAPLPSATQDDEDALEELLRSELPPPMGEAAGPSEDLVLDAFEDEAPAERPVVLLGERDRKTNRPPGEPEPPSAQGPRSGEYMSDLARRLEGDDDT